jgi:hypothetical protein
MSRRDPLAAHIRRLGNHDLNELLLQLPKPQPGSTAVRPCEA